MTHGEAEAVSDPFLRFRDFAQTTCRLLLPASIGLLGSNMTDPRRDLPKRDLTHGVISRVNCRCILGDFQYPFTEMIWKQLQGSGPFELRHCLHNGRPLGTDSLNSFLKVQQI